MKNKVYNLSLNNTTAAQSLLFGSMRHVQLYTSSQQNMDSVYLAKALICLLNCLFLLNLLFRLHYSSNKKFLVRLFPV